MVWFIVRKLGSQRWFPTDLLYHPMIGQIQVTLGSGIHGPKPIGPGPTKVGNSRTEWFQDQAVRGSLPRIIL